MDTTPAPAATATSSNTGKLFFYFSTLTLLVYLPLPHGYFIDIATTYMLKNHLHASATQVSLFRLLTGLPIYFSFVFGFIRDQWNPFGLRDRGYFLLFGGVTAVIFVWMALSNLSYVGLFAGMFLAMATFRLVSGAYMGLMALVAQEQLMSGRLSALWQIVSSIPYIAGGVASGFVTEHMKPEQTFLLAAGLSLAIVAFGAWKPGFVFGHAYDQPLAVQKRDIWGDIKRLVRHRAIYPAVLLSFLFQFAPGQNTPLQFYLTNTLHASDAVYGDYYAIFAASFIPVFFLYGWLCKKVSLEKLLWWGTLITVPQMVPMAFIHSGEQALLLAVPTGMMGGVAAAAYYDLAMRSCPPGLQGTLMMMVDGMLQLSGRGGDMLGSAIYTSSPTHGFLYCVIATTAVYALMLPVILLVPRDLIRSRDGERNPEIDAEVAAEVLA